MKKLLIALLFIPMFAFGQQKDSLFGLSDKLSGKKNTPDTSVGMGMKFKNQFDAAGFHLQKASQDYNVSLLFAAVGAGAAVALASSSNGSSTAIGVGGAFAILGIIFHIEGNHQMKLSGDALRKIQLTGNSVSLNF